MPCDCSHMKWAGHKCDGPRWVYENEHASEILKWAGATRAQDLQSLEAILCYVATRASRGDAWPAILDGNPSLRAFVRLHEMEDAARIREENRRAGIEAARAAAKSKLSPEELAALGLNDLL